MKEGAALSYSIFAVVQRDRSRVDVDESFASIPKESPHGFAPSASASALAPNRADYVVEGLEDEDMLQAALRASLETVPEGFRLPSTPPRAPPPALPAGAPPPPHAREELSVPEDEFETESEAETSSVAEPEPQLSMEEIRRKRLAKFGG